MQFSVAAGIGHTLESQQRDTDDKTDDLELHQLQLMNIREI